jgi:HlyD family secretion protein
VKRIVIIAAVLALLGAIVFASIRAGSKQKGTKIYAEEVAKRDILQVVKASGGINPRIKVNISAHVVAKIEKLYVKEGDRIEKGKPFLQLEEAAFLAQRDQWAAQLRSAETAVRQAQVTLDNTKVKLDRAKRLQKEGIATVEQLETAALDNASAKLHLEEAQEAVSQSRANLVKAQDDLSKTTIYAPISGKVIALNAEEGEVVVSGTMNNAASVIGTIADLSEILAEVDVDETEIVSVRTGQKGTLKVDALPNKLYHGVVTEVGSSGYSRPAQPDVTFFKVKLLLSDADDQLRSGMSVRAEIQTKANKETLVVPVQAVVDRAPLKSDKDTDKKDTAEVVKVVFVIEDGKARQRTVRTGITDEAHVEILDGVKAGEKVATGPYRSLRDLKDGDVVQIGKPGDDQPKGAKPGGGG